MALAVVVTVAVGNNMSGKWQRFLIALHPVLALPALLGAGYLALPHDWYGVPVAVYVCAMVLYNEYRKYRKIDESAAKISELAADQHGSSLDMMRELLVAIDLDSNSYRLSKLARLVAAKMTAESLVDRMRSGASDVKPD